MRAVIELGERDRDANGDRASGRESAVGLRIPAEWRVVLSLAPLGIVARRRSR
jgi:hypothetical protein